jgi:Neuraminidase (sialidase)
MRRLYPGVAAGVVLILVVAVAVATAATVSTPVKITTSSPLTSCNLNFGPGSVIYDNTTAEPYTAVNPTNSDNVISVWQQDRRNDGGARGLLAAYSTDAGKTWTTPPVADQADFDRCTGGNAANGGNYDRDSDPWVTFDQHGNAFQISISFTIADFISAGGPSAVLVSKSTDGGATWGPNTVLRSDTATDTLNDKEMIAGDPHHPDNVYAVWDRLEFPNASASAKAGENAVGYRGPTWFSRTTNDGASWEQAHIIFDPGEVNQTIGNEIVPLGDDSALVDGFDLIFNFKNTNTVRGENVALIRSTDHGETWSQPIIVSKLLSVGVRNSNGERLRTGDIIPQFAADPRATSDTIYAVWQDSRFTGGARDQIAFSKSTDGGLQWSTPVRINTHTSTPAFNPSIRVGSDGTVNVTYYDFRNDSDFDGDSSTAGDSSTLLTDVWSLTSKNGGRTWTEDRVTPSSFDFRSAPVARGFFLGDYQGLDFADGGTLPGFKAAFGESDGSDATSCSGPFSSGFPTCPTTSPKSDIFGATIAP